jgi:hypothetical protein
MIKSISLAIYHCVIIDKPAPAIQIHVDVILDKIDIIAEGSLVTISYIRSKNPWD